MQRPKLLFVSPRFLFPTNEGGKIRTANILRRMKGGAFEIVLASPAPAERQRFLTDIDACCDRFICWPERKPKLWRRVLALFHRAPISVALDASADGKAVVAGALRDTPAVTVVDFPHASVLLPHQLPHPSVLFTHNVEAEIFERHAEVARGLMRLVWRGQARKMAAFEGIACQRFNAVVAVSARDAKALSQRFGLLRVERIDTGVDLDFFRFSSPDMPTATIEGGATVVFTGVLDSPANIDGVRFLMTEVWPLLVRQYPAARAIIVGRNPPASLVSLAAAKRLPFTFTGFVDDIRPYVAASQVSVIPLRVGSGTRIKAFEAMAMGRPVVSTRVGVEGLDLVDGLHYLSADDPSGFAAAIGRLFDNPALRCRLARDARAQLEARFSWAHVARQFEQICLRVGDARPS